MKWLVLGVLCLFPLIGFAVARRWTAGRGLPIAVAGCIGAAIGAFIGSAASAMATAVDPDVALLRAGGIGLAGGLALGGLATLLLGLRPRRR